MIRFALILLALLSTPALAMGSSTDVKCVPGGCSGQLCVAEGKDKPSTCEWTQAYACYKTYGQCEVQANGSCGWTKTFELDACLKDPERFRDMQ